MKKGTKRSKRKPKYTKEDLRWGDVILVEIVKATKNKTVARTYDEFKANNKAIFYLQVMSLVVFVIGVLTSLFLSTNLGTYLFCLTLILTFYGNSKVPFRAVYIDRIFNLVDKELQSDINEAIASEIKRLDHEKASKKGPKAKK